MRLPSLLVVAAMMLCPTITVPKKPAQPQVQSRSGCSSASSAVHNGASDGSTVRIHSGGGGLSSTPSARGETESVRARARPARLIERDDPPGRACRKRHIPRSVVSTENAGASDRLGLDLL